MNEQLFAAQNTQDSSDFYPEDEKTTSAANAEAKENQCAAADAEEISEIETGCSIKDMVAIDVCRSEKTEEHEPGQAADKTSAIDESPEADMMLIAQREDSVSEETENTLAEEAAEAEKNDVQEHQAKIISMETKIDEPQGIEQTEESSADVIDPAEYQLEKEYMCRLNSGSMIKRCWRIWMILLPANSGQTNELDCFCIPVDLFNDLANARPCRRVAAEKFNDIPPVCERRFLQHREILHDAVCI